MNGDIDSEDEIRHFEQDQTFLALVALSDPIRQNIKEDVSTATQSGIHLRLISGDNLNTTAAVAVDVGILTREEFVSMKRHSETPIAMNAKEFREQVGEVIKSEIVAEDG
jgi:magnesium-transporting ATPase (P-type)